MGLHRRSKLTFNAFRSFRDFTCKFTPMNSIQNVIRNTHQSIHSFTHNTSAISNPYIHQRYSGVRLGKEKLSPCLFGARRNYSVDLGGSNSPWTVFNMVLIGTGLAATVYLGNLETVPYTNRTHLVLFSYNVEKYFGEAEFKHMKNSFQGKILPETHPQSVRVRSIANDIFNALRRDLIKDNVSTDLGHSLNSYNSDNKTNGLGALMPLKDDNGVLSNLGENYEIADDTWVENIIKKGKQKPKKPTTDHLEAFDWEILVVSEPDDINAFCMPGGKIVVFTGLLDSISSNDEIATILCHEVAHGLSRHCAEGIAKSLWIFILQFIFFDFVTHDIAKAISTLFLTHPFTRKMEIEADYIGLLIMASAGYDPQVAPGVLEKTDEINGGYSKIDEYTSTHPSGKKRAMLLTQSKVMEQALLLYQQQHKPA